MNGSRALSRAMLLFVIVVVVFAFVPDDVVAIPSFPLLLPHLLSLTLSLLIVEAAFLGWLAYTRLAQFALTASLMNGMLGSH